MNRSTFLGHASAALALSTLTLVPAESAPAAAAALNDGGGVTFFVSGWILPEDEAADVTWIGVQLSRSWRSAWHG